MSGRNEAEVQKWEGILRREGLAPCDDHDSLFRDGRFVSATLPAGPDDNSGDDGETNYFEERALEFHGTTKWADVPDVELWRDFAAAIHQLTDEWPEKHVALLLAFADTGYLRPAAQATGLTYKQARRIMARFLALAGFETRHGVLHRSGEHSPKSGQASAKLTRGEWNAYALEHGEFPPGDFPAT